MYLAILMQDFEDFDHLCCNISDLASSKPLCLRRIHKIVVQVLQHDSRQIIRIFYLVNQWTESRRSSLKAFKYIAFGLEAKMPDAFDYDGLFGLIAVII